MNNSFNTITTPPSTDGELTYSFSGNIHIKGKPLTISVRVVYTLGETTKYQSTYHLARVEFPNLAKMVEFLIIGGKIQMITELIDLFRTVSGSQWINSEIINLLTKIEESYDVELAKI